MYKQIGVSFFRTTPIGTSQQEARSYVIGGSLEPKRRSNDLVLSVVNVSPIHSAEFADATIPEMGLLKISMVGEYEVLVILINVWIPKIKDTLVELT
jgi:hypothetical protein